MERVEDQKRGENRRGQKISEKNLEIFGPRGINLILEDPKTLRFFALEDVTPRSGMLEEIFRGLEVNNSKLNVKLFTG